MNHGGVAPDTLMWITEDYHKEIAIHLSRSTIYRILARRKICKQREKKPNLYARRYTKDYPGQKVQFDTTEPFGKDSYIQASIIGIRIIRNPVRTPQLNGKVERFHRTVEEECLWRLNPEQQPLEESRLCLRQYIHRHNTKRRHRGLNMNIQTPRQKIKEYIVSIATLIHLPWI